MVESMFWDGCKPQSPQWIFRENKIREKQKIATAQYDLHIVEHGPSANQIFVSPILAELWLTASMRRLRLMLISLKFANLKRKTNEPNKSGKNKKIIDLLTVKAALSVLRESCWYWGNISGDRARKLLKRCEPGTFLIRDSSDKRYLFTLSIMTLRGPTSIRLIFSRGCFRIETSGIISPRSPCVVSLIVRMAYLSRNSVCEQPIKERMDENEKPTGKVDSQINQTFKKQALLEKPLFSKAASLKHLARVAINRYNLRSFVSESAAEYLNQYPYPV